VFLGLAPGARDGYLERVERNMAPMGESIREVLFAERAGRELRTQGSDARSENAEGESKAIPNARARSLRGGEVVPNFAGGLDLEDSTLVRMEEVISIRDPVVCSGLHGATRPVSWTNAAAVLFYFGHEVNSILHAIFNPGWPGGY
jgi:hypothetical protein